MNQKRMIWLVGFLAVFLWKCPACADMGNQLVSLQCGCYEQPLGSSLSVTVVYDATLDNLTGLGVRFHFDSNMLSFAGFNDLYQIGLVGVESTPQDDGADYDNDPATDKFVLIAWMDIQGMWPNQALPMVLCNLGFSVNLAAPPGLSSLNVSFSSTTAGFQGVAAPLTVNLVVPDSGSGVLDNSIIRSDAINSGSVSNISVEPGAVLINHGTVTGLQNSGTVSGGTIGGQIVNQGLINGSVSLASGATVAGGRISGNLTGEAGTVVTDSILDVSSITGVTIGSGCRVTAGMVAGIEGLDLTDAITGPDGFAHPDRPILIDQAGIEISLSGILIDLVNHLMSDTTCTASCDESGRILLSSQVFGGIVIPGMVQTVVTTLQADGVSMAPSGELVLIRNGLATTLEPASPDRDSFENALLQAGCSVNIQENGLTSVTLPGGAKVAFRFSSFATRSATFGNGILSLSVTGTPEAPETFRLSVTYPDGSVQVLPPTIHDFVTFKTALEAGGIVYQIDPMSGVIQLHDRSGFPLWRGIAAYLFEDPPTGAIGFSLEMAGDLTSDGTNDFYMITGMAKQIIYTLP